MRLRVHDLAGAALDYWAAKAAAVDGPQIVDGICRVGASPYQPSSSWAHGGPLVEAAQISLWRYADLDSWHACVEFGFVREEGIKAKHYYQGPTALTAAMRCLVASHFGNEVPGG